MSIYEYDAATVAEVTLSSLPVSVQGALKAISRLSTHAILVRVDEDNNLVQFDAISADFIPEPV